MFVSYSTDTPSVPVCEFASDCAAVSCPAEFGNAVDDNGCPLKGCPCQGAASEYIQGLISADETIIKSAGLVKVNLMMKQLSKYYSSCTLAHVKSVRLFRQ